MKKLFAIILLFYPLTMSSQHKATEAPPIGIETEGCDKALSCGYPRIYEFCPASTDENSDGDYDGPLRHSYRMDMPTDDSRLSMNIRQWMAEMISHYCQFQLYYIAAFDNSPVAMMEAFREDFYEEYIHSDHEMLVFCNEAFDFYRYYESPTYVTYRFGSESGTGQVRYATFHKKSGRRLGLTDFVHPDNEHQWRMLVLKHAAAAIDNRHRQQSTAYSHHFMRNIASGKQSVDSVSMGDVALWPTGMVVCFQASDIDDFDEGRYEIVVPYGELSGMLLVPPMETDAKDVFIESYRKACAYADFIGQEGMKRAPVYTEQYLNELASTQGKSNGTYLHALEKTAYMAYKKQQYDRAATLYDEYLSVAENCCEPLDMAWWVPANRQLECLMKCRQYDEVLTLGNKLLPTQRQLAGFYDEIAAYRMQHATLTTMAEAAYLSNRAAVALDLLSQAMPLSEMFDCDHADALGETGVCHVHLTDSMNMTRYQQALGLRGEVTANVKKIAPLVRTALYEDFRYTSAFDRKNRWQKMEKWYTEFLPSVALLTNDEELLADAYDAILFGRGLLLNSDVAIKRILLEKGSDEEKALIDSVDAAKRELETLQTFREDDRLRKMEEIYNKIDELEWEITNNSFNHDDFTKGLFVNHRAVREGLNEKDLAIEFLRFPIAADSIVYAALTLGKAYDAPRMTLLCDERQLTGIQYPSPDDNSLSSISHLVWGPLSSELENIENIYFSPAGELYKIGIEYAEDMQKYNLYRLSSTRLVATKNNINEKDGAVSATLFGGLKYQFDSDKWADLKRRKDSGLQTSFRDVPMIDTRAWCERISFLPGTKKEVKAIDKTLRSSGRATTLFTGTEGTEDAFKQLSGKRTSILHIATHGFYHTTTVAAAPETASRGFDDIVLSSSGLFMAGAADALDERSRRNIPEGVDDGVLTAKEIAQMDLRAVDLVVLSACETGLGHITGDGVFGLQRGFKKAGANTLLMSLWKVNDQATQHLMMAFYQNLSGGQSKRQAFINAQQYLRQCENGKYGTPFYWAAFILLDAID